jgi:hypothetical protein
MEPTPLSSIDGYSWPRREKWLNRLFSCQPPAKVRRVAHPIANRAGRSRHVFNMSVDKLAYECGTSHNVVRQALRWLCAMGFLIHENPGNKGGNNSTNEYSMSLPGSVPPSDAEADSADRPRDGQPSPESRQPSLLPPTTLRTGDTNSLNAMNAGRGGRSTDTAEVERIDASTLVQLNDGSHWPVVDNGKCVKHGLAAEPGRRCPGIGAA